MKYITILVALISLCGCGSRIKLESFAVSVDNEVGLFQSDSSMVTQAVAASVDYKLKKQNMISKLDMENGVSEIHLKMVSDKVKFNPSWLWGDGYTRTVEYDLQINGNTEMVKISVDTSKDGAIDRFVGHVSGLGSHPGIRAFPGTLGRLIESIADDILTRIE